MSQNLVTIEVGDKVNTEHEGTFTGLPCARRRSYGKDKRKRRFLVSCEAGDGFVWYWMEAPSSEALRAVFPGFAVYEELPEWWSMRPTRGIAQYRLGDPMTPRLTMLKVKSESRDRGSGQRDMSEEVREGRTE